MKEQVRELATEVWQTSHWTNEQIKRLERFYSLVRNAAMDEAAQKCVASELIDMPTRHEIATVRKCAKAIESLKEPTP